MQKTKEFYQAQKFTAVCHYVFKLALVGVSVYSIHLGHDLYIQGVTGKASLVVNSQETSAQLINAAPGLFFALGGLCALCGIIYKSSKVFIPYPDNSAEGSDHA